MDIAIVLFCASAGFVVWFPRLSERALQQKATSHKRETTCAMRRDFGTFACENRETSESQCHPTILALLPECSQLSHAHTLLRIAPQNYYHYVFLLTL